MCLPATAELPCNCSSEGSLDPNDCDRLTGQCLCIAGHSGRQCQDCQEDHFTNGSTGCLPCHCNSSGALSQRCDSSGVCVCKAGVDGDKCDRCHPGSFGFGGAGCQPCQCNNHSTHCHNQTGICLNCQGNTRGPSCEECKYNFYRRPGATQSEGCLPCPCSSVTSTASCHIDPSGQPVCDQCKPEYQGSHCDECRDGFFNSDSLCVSCNCSGNADPLSLPRLCDPETGRCLSCANHTSGENCERCAEGYVGDALAHSCAPEVHPTTPSLETSMTSTSAPETSVSALTFRPHANATASPGVPLTSAADAATTTPTATLSPLANATAALGVVSWSQFNVIVLSVVIVLLVVLMGVAGAVYTFREYRNRKVNAPFWTIELKEDNISFSSYHDSLPNMDVAGLLDEEEVNEEAPPSVHLSIGSSENMFKP
ncbi:multiple epidermal growth factor-like domains protein 9 [Aplochiton taeniatus]